VPAPLNLQVLSEPPTIYPVSRGEDMANLQIGKVGTVLNTVLLLFRIGVPLSNLLYLFEITKLTGLT
jgi:hypothetical protein